MRIKAFESIMLVEMSDSFVTAICSPDRFAPIFNPPANFHCFDRSLLLFFCSARPSAMSTTDAPTAPVDLEARKKELLKITKPDEAVYSSTMDKLAKEVEAAQKKIDALKKQISGTKEAKTSASAEFAERKAKIDALVAKVKARQPEKERLEAELTAAQEQRTRIEQSEKKLRESLPYSSNEECDRKIAELEAKIESGDLSVPEEKKVLQAIQNARRSRPLVAEHARTREAMAAAKDLVNALYPAVKAVRDEIFAIRNELKTANDELTAYVNKNKDSLPNTKALSEQIDKLHAEIKETNAKKSALYASNKTSMDAYFNAQRELKKIRDIEYRERRAAEDQARKKAEADERKAQLEEERRSQWVTEIDTCAHLVGYLEQLQSGSATVAAPRPKTGETRKKLSELEQQGFYIKKKETVVGKKKQPQQQASASAEPEEQPAAEEKKEEKPEAKERPLTIPFDKLQAFSVLGVKAPMMKGDVAAALAQVQAKKAEFEAKRAEAMRKLEEDLKALEVKEAQPQSAVEAQ
jgi:uncharacterized coiled-coil DUF342 family protein